MIRVSKLSATGNDFLLVGLHTAEALAEWNSLLQKFDRRQIAMRLCDRHEGVGADGMLFFSTARDADFAWDFYNQDGSSAEMCGNAARCAGLWAARVLGQWREFHFQTAAGRVSVRRLEGGMIEALMPPVELKEDSLELKLSNGRVRTTWVNSGVPHAVIREESLKALEVLRAQAKELRNHEHFGVAGANVTYYVESDKQKISALTYERGVEDFTRACGTGAVAAAFVHRRKYGGDQVLVQVPGGRLGVALGEDRPRLSGSAHWVADCILDLSPDGVLHP